MISHDDMAAAAAAAEFRTKTKHDGGGRFVFETRSRDKLDGAGWGRFELFKDERECSARTLVYV